MRTGPSTRPGPKAAGTQRVSKEPRRRSSSVSSSQRRSISPYSAAWASEKERYEAGSSQTSIVTYRPVVSRSQRSLVSLYPRAVRNKRAQTPSAPY